jgi:hypothetical protein
MSDSTYPDEIKIEELKTYCIVNSIDVLIIVLTTYGRIHHAEKDHNLQTQRNTLSN